MSRERAVAAMRRSMGLLARLIDSADLRLEERCARLIRAKCVLMDSSRLRERALVRLAAMGPRLQIERPAHWPPAWVDAQIEQAFRDLLNEDGQAEAEGAPIPDQWSSPHSFMIPTFGIEGRHARTAAVRFNHLPERTRRVFFALLIEDVSVEECRVSGLGTSASMQDCLEEAFRALFLEPPRTRSLALRAPLSIGENLLSAEERQILLTHRVEVAGLLTSRVRHALLQDSHAAARFNAYHTMEKKHEPMDETEWRSRSEYCIGSTSGLASCPRELDLLRRTTMPEPPRHPSPIQIAAAAMRLAPSPSRRSLLGMALFQAGQHEHALHHLHDVVQGKSSALDVSFAWENIGLVEWERGRRTHSLDAYRESSLIQEPRAHPVLSWLVVAIRNGDTASAREAAACLAERVPEGHPCLADFRRLQNARFQMEGPAQHEAFRRSLHDMERSLPPIAREFASAL